MRWGKTRKEREELELCKNKRWFAWYPIRFRDGSWGWLERVYRYYVPHHRSVIYKQRGVKI